MTQQTYDRIIAAVITAVIASLILIALFMSGMSFERDALSQNTSTEQPMEEEEFFIEPLPLVEDPGEPDPEVADAGAQEAPAEQGEPDPAPVDNNKIVVNGENDKPAPQRPKPITQTKPSPVKVTEPKKTDKPESRVTSKVASGFAGKNGAVDGKPGGQGTGGVGTSAVKGSSRGRGFISCPKPNVSLKQKVVIVVNVTINENGNAISARATGSAERYLRVACEQAALKSKWDPKKGAGNVQGVITFTITPKL